MGPYNRCFLVILVCTFTAHNSSASLRRLGQLALYTWNTDCIPCIHVLKEEPTVYNLQPKSYNSQREWATFVREYCSDSNKIQTCLERTDCDWYNRSLKYYKERRKFMCIWVGRAYLNQLYTQTKCLDKIPAEAAIDKVVKDCMKYYMPKIRLVEEDSSCTPVLHFQFCISNNIEDACSRQTAWFLMIHWILEIRTWVPGARHCVKKTPYLRP